MARIALYKDNYADSTVVSNLFIDEYMKDANDAQLKVYFYLLRMLNAEQAISVSGIADKFNHTEKDVIRALKYWEGEKLIALAYTAEQKLSGITLLEPFADTGHRESSASMDTFTGSGNSASVSGNTDPGVPSSADYILSLTPDRIRELKQNEEISQLLYITEQYLTKTLTPT